MPLDKITYSVIIPLKNEESCIADLIEELEPVMNGLKQTWELICIDDGSTDQTRLILKNLTTQKPYLKLICFDRNYGQSSAFEAGFKAACGTLVITLDGDGQNDPADIPKLLSHIEECDLVCGIRTIRRDSWSKRFISRWANCFRNWVCADDIRDTGCSLKVYRRACLGQIKMYHGMHRFLPTLFKYEGYRVKQLPVHHRPRLRGISKYHFFNRSFNTIADLCAVNWMRKRRLHYKIETVVVSKELANSPYAK